MTFYEPVQVEAPSAPPMMPPNVAQVQPLPQQHLPQIHRYRQLGHSIRALQSQQVEQQLASATSELSHAQAELNSATQACQKLQQVVHHDQEMLKGAEHPFVLKKLLIPGKCEERLERRHHKLEAHEEAKRGAEAARAAAAGHVEVAGGHMGALTQQVASLKAQVMEQGSLIASLFAPGMGPYGSDPEALRLTAAAASAGAFKAACEGKMQRYAQALGLIERGFAHMQRSHALLRSALGLAQVDVIGAEMRMMDPFAPTFGNTGGGMMVDMMERQQAQEGVRQAQRGVQLLLEADSLMPGAIPRISPHMLRQFGSGFFQLVFDNVFTDLMVMQKIQENLWSVEQMERDTAGAVAWMRAQIETSAKPEVASAVAAEAQAVAALDAYRRRVLDAAAAAAGLP